MKNKKKEAKTKVMRKEKRKREESKRRSKKNIHYSLFDMIPINDNVLSNMVMSLSMTYYSNMILYAICFFC
jgi:hypothetical protein